MTAQYGRLVVGMVFALVFCRGVSGIETPAVAKNPPPLGEWSTGCNPGFKLSAMPSAWSFFPGQSSLVVKVRPAIDFEQLSPKVYSVQQDQNQGERIFDLTGFDFMVLQAEIRNRKTGRVVRVMPGLYVTDDGKMPVVFEWDGRTRDGLPAKPGLYEVEVRGRFVPVWAGIRAGDGYQYRDFDGWSIVEEACRRTLTVEVLDKAASGGVDRGISCAPPPASYYGDVDATDSASLRSSLHPVIDDHARFPYSSTSIDTWDILNNADENPSNTSQLLSIYKNEAYAEGCSSGCDSTLGWNREHTWAKSYGFSEETGFGRIPYTDCHHLRAADQGYNSSRGNKPHDNCPGCTEKPTDFNNGFGGTAGEVNRTTGGSTSCGETPTSGNIWETWDHRKGDVARTILYMDIRYEGGIGEQDLVATSDLALMMVETTSCGDGYQDPAYHGVLSTLLAWHAADPVDSDEARRNNQVWCYQGNRNPFVDHPEWVDCLYRDICSGGPTFAGVSSAADIDACVDDGVQIDWSQPTDWNDGCLSGCSNRSFTVSRNGTAISSGGCSGTFAAGLGSCVDDEGADNTVYTYRVVAINQDGDTSDGGTTENAGDFIDDAAGPLITVGPAVVPTADSFTVTWTSDEPSDSSLEWGTETGTYTSITNNGADVVEHSLTATSLSSTTEYFYRVCSTDPCGNGPSCSAEGSVTTTLDCDAGTDTGVFINEFHYDNTGGDTGEFFEIAGPAGTDLGNGPWTVELYSGAVGTPGVVYDTVSLSGTIDNEGTGYGAVGFFRTGIQNGDPADGLALIDGSGSVVQFLCYEGSFAAAFGTTAYGTPCQLIGVEEDETTPIGYSLQLTGGSAFVYEDFAWSTATLASPGDLNSGQTMACGPSPPTFAGIASAGDLDPCDSTGVRIAWASPSSWNDGCSSGCSRGFHIYRDGSLITAGACADSQSEATISCVDTTGTVGTLHTYVVSAFNNDGNVENGGAAAGARDATNDGVAPVITIGPTATPSSASFSVSWQTDEASNSSLQWGTSPGTYTSSSSDAADVVEHSLSATNLSSNVTYYFQVCSTDPCGQGPTCSNETTVVTSGGCTADAGETPVFINEFHYDNSDPDNNGLDVGEFIEIAGPAGTDLSAYSLVLYNGSSSVRKPYNTRVLSGSIPDQGGSGYGAVAFDYPTDGIQNGAPDGFALVQGATVVQFLCYEGSFTAETTANGGGPAAGMTCTDIVVDEQPPADIGTSLQLKGGPGFVYEDFTWNEPSAESPGLINVGQDMSCVLPPDQIQFFTATSTDGQVLLEWENPASYPTGGTTRICRDPSSYPTDPETCTIAGAVTEIAGSDASYASLVDTTNMTNDSRYFYAAWVIDSNGLASNRKTVSARPFDTSGSAKWTYHSAASSLASPGLYPGSIGAGAVFAVANDNSLHSMDPGDAGGSWPLKGSFHWRPMPMNGPAHQRPPVVPVLVGGANLVVFLGSEDGHAYAVDAFTGATLWQSPVLASMITGAVAGQFTVFGGSYDLLFVGSRDAEGANTVSGLHLADGSIAWTFDNGASPMGIISSGPTVDYPNNRLYFASREHATGSSSTMWCLAFTDTEASLVWERSLGDIDGAPVLFDGRIYVGTNAGEVHALDAETGSSLWVSPFSTADGPVKGFVAPGFSALPRRLVAATTTTVWALTDDGAAVSQEWQQPGVAGPSIPLTLDGIGLFLGATDGSLYQLDEDTGAVTASVILGDGTAVVGSPSYDYLNGIAYVGSESGEIFAVTLPLS